MSSSYVLCACHCLVIALLSLIVLLPPSLLSGRHRPCLPFLSPSPLFIAAPAPTTAAYP